MSLVADKVDHENCTISDVRLVNADSRNNRFFEDSSLQDIAKHGEGKPIMLDTHGEVGISPNVGTLKGLKFAPGMVVAETAKLKKTHEKTPQILETASDEDFNGNCGFSVEVREGDFDSYVNPQGVQVITAVRKVAHFVIATHTGNTNGIFETEQPAESSEEPMSKIESVGDIRTAYPKLVGEIELAAKAEAEKSHAEETAEINQKLTDLEKKVVEKQGQIEAFEKQQRDAEAEEKQIEAEAEIEKELCGCGCNETDIKAMEPTIKKLAGLGDKDLTETFIAQMKPKRSGGLPDSVGDTAPSQSLSDIMKRRRKELKAGGK